MPTCPTQAKFAGGKLLDWEGCPLDMYIKENKQVLTRLLKPIFSQNIMLNNPVTGVYQLSGLSANNQLEHSSSILLAELESLFQKTNTRRKLLVA